MLEFTCTIESVTTTTESGWGVMRASVDKSQRLPTHCVKGGMVVLVGDIGTLCIGDEAIISGVEDSHPTFGPQIKVNNFVVDTPSDVQAVKIFLTEYTKGIDKVRSKAIVSHFGDSVYDVLDTDPERLTEVPGIGRMTMEVIRKSWKEHPAEREVLKFFCRAGISRAMVSKVLKEFGDHAPQIIERDPYELARRVDNIGFKTADAIARRLGLEETSIVRVRALYDYTIERIEADKGDCWVTHDQLMKGIQEYVDTTYLTPQLLDEAYKSSIDEELIVDEDGRIYRKKTHRDETSSAMMLSTLISTPAFTDASCGLAALDRVISRKGITLHEKQRQAIENVFRNKVSILTGGPGCGKTFCIQLVVEVLQELGTITLMAPTGKASKRMAEVTLVEASTIHRNLHEFERDIRSGMTSLEDGRLVSVVVIDETSMVDVNLFRRTLNYIDPSSIVLFVGDADQLPSVSCGAVFRDLIVSNVIPTTILTKIFRQGEHSRISLAAHAINAGQMPEIVRFGSEYGIPNSDFLTAFIDDSAKQVEALRWCVSTLVPRLGFDPIKDLQVVSPMKNGVNGVNNLNSVLQDLLNPNGSPHPHPSCDFRTGDKVMLLKNDAEANVFNGDIGIVKSFTENPDSKKPRELDINIAFDVGDRLRQWKHHRQLQMAYASTIHKMQGSETPVLIMLLSYSHYIMLQRNLVYTGITRGKQKVILLTDSRALGQAIRNNQPNKRQTWLDKRLQESLQERMTT